MPIANSVPCPDCGGDAIPVVSEFAPTLNISEEESERMVGVVPNEYYCMNEDKKVKPKEVKYE